MAILRKTAVFQVRCHAGDLAAFEASCEVIGMKPTERIRRFMVADAQAIAKKVAAKAQWEATKASRAAAAASVSPEHQKPPVEPVVASEGPLARKRRLEKEAKDSRAAKRHNRY